MYLVTLCDKGGAKSSRITFNTTLGDIVLSSYKMTGRSNIVTHRVHQLSYSIISPTTTTDPAAHMYISYGQYCFSTSRNFHCHFLYNFIFYSANVSEQKELMQTRHISFKKTHFLEKEN